MAVRLRFAAPRMVQGRFAMSLEHNPARQCRFGRIRKAVEYGGISRSGLYVLAGAHPDLFVKFGKSTLVNFDVLDRVLDRLPRAKVKGASRAA